MRWDFFVFFLTLSAVSSVSIGTAQTNIPGNFDYCKNCLNLALLPTAVTNKAAKAFSGCENDSKCRVMLEGMPESVIFKGSSPFVPFSL